MDLIEELISMEAKFEVGDKVKIIDIEEDRREKYSYRIGKICKVLRVRKHKEDRPICSKEDKETCRRTSKEACLYVGNEEEKIYLWSCSYVMRKIKE